MTFEPGAPDLVRVRSSLQVLDRAVRDGERERIARWHARVSGSPYALSAANLAAYLAFRQHDIRELQDELAGLGLSSLGRLEANVRTSIASVRLAVDALLGAPPDPSHLARLGRLRVGQRQALADRTAALLGPAPEGRRTRVMVTLPGEAAGDPGLIRALMAAGMDLARINAAHDGIDAWQAMAAHVRAAAEESGRTCRILIDLPGPKLRIAALPGTRALLRLRRPDAGDAPSRVELDGSGRPGVALAEPGMLPRVAVGRRWVDRLREGDRIGLVDARGRERILEVERRTPTGSVIAAIGSGIALEQGIRLTLLRGGRSRATTRIGPFEPMPGSIEVRVGDAVRLVDQVVGATARDGLVDGVPALHCPQPEVVLGLQVGHRVILDDGHVVTRVESVDDRGALLRVSATRRPRERLRTDEGLNVPDTPIRLRSTSADDLAVLDAAARLADIVGLSFAQDADDVDRLVRELDARGAGAVGVVAKIETRRGVEGLPELIVAGAGRRPFGVMIARGDLAVEIGYERLAEIQEQLLWLCEAAHVPAIWATQVLESLVKVGIPTRAELTDAAMAQRAECVMLNKGPFIVQGVETLVDVIRRMETHQDKKTALLRALGSW
jgi:pyruvate kinase